MNKAIVLKRKFSPFVFIALSALGVYAIFVKLLNNSNPINLYSLPPLITSILFFFSGFYVYSKNKDSDINLSFSLLWFSTATWLMGYSIIYSIKNYQQAMAIAKILYIGVIFIPATFYHFTIAFLKKEKKDLIPVYLISFIFFFFNVFTSGFVNDLYTYHWGYYVKPGFVHHIFILFFGLIYGKGLFNLYQGYKTKSPLTPDYKRIKYVFWSFTIALIGSTDFIPNYGIEYYPFGYMLVGICLTLISYSIVKFRLMDIETVVHKTILWAITSSLIFFPLYFMLKTNRDALLNMSTIQLTLIIGALAVLLTNYLKYIQPRIDHFFGRRHYNIQNAINKFLEELASLKGINELTEKIIQLITDILYIDQISLFLIDEEKGNYALIKSLNVTEQLSFPLNDPFFRWIEENPYILEKDQLELNPQFAEIKNEALNYFSNVKAHLLIPLIHNNSLIGLINLNKKRNLREYTEREIYFLNKLKTEACIAISNSLLFDKVQQQNIKLIEGKEKITRAQEELKKINEELEKMVGERTKQVIFFEKMASIGQLTSGIGHELNNPINYILNYANVLHNYITKLQLVWDKYETLENKNGELDEIKFLKDNIGYEKKLKGIYAAISDIIKGSQRVAGIVQSMRSLTRKDSQRGTADLNKIIEETILILSNKLKLKQILLQTDIKPDLNVECYPSALGQVILNLLDNSIYAVKEGGKIWVSAAKNGNFFKITIKDNGCGISKEIQEKIFDPFFTTKPPGEGTGLGLNITYNIITELHRGKIELKSEKEKETEFIITCPIK